MTPPWLRLLDPSDRLTLAFNDLYLDDQRLAQRRRRRSVTPPSITPQVPNSVPVPTQPQSVGSAPVTRDIPHNTQGQDGLRGLGIRTLPLLGILENGGILTTQYGLALQGQYRVSSWNLLGGLGYGYRNLGEVTSVGALSSRSEPVHLHEVGATFGLEDNSWDPRSSSVVWSNSSAYFGAGGSSSTWARLSLNVFTGGQATQAHQPIFQFSLGNTSTLLTGGGRNFEIRLGLTNEVRFSSQGAAINGLPNQYEGDLISPVALGLVSLEAWYFPQGRLDAPARPSQLSRAEFIRGFGMDAVNLVVSSMRAAMILEAAPALALLANSPANDRRSPADIAQISLLPRAELSLQSSVMGWVFGARAADIARNWSRMDSTQRLITSIESGILGGASLLSLFIFQTGDNFFRTMAPSLLAAQSYQWLGVVTRDLGDWRWLVHGGVAALGLVGFFTSNALAGSNHPSGCEGGLFSRSVFGICDGALGGVRGYDADRNGFVRDIHRTVDWNSSAMALLGGTFNFALGGQRSSSVTNNSSEATPRTSFNQQSGLRFSLTANPRQFMLGLGGIF